jgi:hypothetical protein
LFYKADFFELFRLTEARVTIGVSREKVEFNHIKQRFRWQLVMSENEVNCLTVGRAGRDKKAKGSNQ